MPGISFIRFYNLYKIADLTRHFRQATGWQVGNPGGAERLGEERAAR